MELYGHIPLTLGHCPRVGVLENPFARRELPQHVFQGSWDARHRFNQHLGQIERVFAGENLKKLEAQSENGRDILQTIEQFKQGIVEAFRPERIILFGSHAYGSPEPGSDVDLLVVFPGRRGAAHRSLEIRKRLIHDFPLDLLTFSAGEIARRVRLNDPFVKEILSKGKTLYESPHG